jgi:hypothetical protein
MTRRMTVLITLALALFASSGCSGLKERLTPPPKIVTQEATRAASDAQVSGELDESTPSDLPLWPGAKVVDSTTTDDAYSLTLTTAEKFTDVLNGVAAGFEEAGWSVAVDESGEPGGRSAILQISRESEEGFVTLTEIESGLTQIDYVVASSAMQ